MQPDAVRVLFVEDSETDFELMVHALRQSGFAVTAARVDREPALTEALRSFAPDIVLSDHALPQASGREVLQAIQREQPMLPVLIVTGSSDDITLLDEAGTIMYSTQSLKPTLGYAAGEMTGHNVSELIHPDQQPAVGGLLEKLFRDPRQIVQTDLRVRHKDGSWRDL